MFVNGAPRVWSAPPLIEHAGPSVFAISGDGTRIVALVPDPASADRFRHVVNLWTDVAGAPERHGTEQRH